MSVVSFSKPLDKTVSELNGNVAKKANSKNINDGLSDIDLNTMKETGIYGIERATNAPVGYIYGTLTVERYNQNGTFVNQTWRDAAQTKVFVRNYHDNSWTTWEELVLNTKIEIQSGTIDVTGITQYFHNKILKKSCGVKMLSFTIGHVDNVTAQGSYVKVGTLPEGFRPSTEMSCLFRFSTDTKLEVRLYTNGDIKFYNYTSTKQDGEYLITYI